MKYYLRISILVVLVIALLSGCASKQERAINTLRDKGISYTDDKVFIDYLSQDDKETIGLFIDAGYDINKKYDDFGTRGETPLMGACIYGAVNCASLLIDKGANLAAVNDNDLNALDYAVQGKSPEVVKLLLDKGMSPNQVAPGDVTPLMMTCTYDAETTKIAPALYKSRNTEPAVKIQILQILIDKGADITLFDAAGQNVLHYAASFTDSPEIISFLVSKGVVNVMDNNGETPVYKTIRFNKPNAAAAFITNGVIMSFEDFNNIIQVTDGNRTWKQIIFTAIGSSTEAITSDKLAEDRLISVGFHGDTNYVAKSDGLFDYYGTQCYRVQVSNKKWAAEGGSGSAGTYVVSPNGMILEWGEE